jgi:hypothetical protein
MSVRAYLSKSGKAAFLNPAIRMGLCTGAGLSAIFIAWVVVANRVPALEVFAMQRNVAAEAALGFLALLPVVRFMRRPGRLLISGVVAWTLLSLAYWAMAFHFVGLTERWSTFEIFTKGGLAYLIASTLAWVGACAWRAKNLKARRIASPMAQPLPASHISHSNHHTS